MQFDGQNDHEVTADGDQLSFGAADGYTISCRMKSATTDSIADYTGLVSKITSLDSVGVGWQLLIVNNRVAAEVWESDDRVVSPRSDMGELVGTTPLNDAEWHHVALTVDRTSGTAVLYQNGEPEKTVTNDILKCDPDNDAPLRIGRDRAENYFVGDIKDVKAWGRVLDATEISNEAAGVSEQKPEVPPVAPPKISAPGAASRPRARRPVQPDTPEYLIPRIGKFPVSDAMHFVTAHLVSGSGSGEAKVISGPIEPKPAAAAQLPASGVLLTHGQDWTARGLALGNLLHSVTLAPGEVTQVAVIDWRRQESGSARESTEQSDSASASDNRDRAVDDVQQSTLNEVQSGSSFATSASVDAQAGYATPFFSIGGGANTTTGYSTKYSDGSRNLSLSENQKINEATMRNAQASRSRRAAVVRETTQSESEQLTTRVVANYNHAHAMTMMYFEVVEVFDVTTQVTDAERLIYLPMEVAEIDEELLSRYSGQFSRAAESAGDAVLAGMIRNWVESGPDVSKMIQPQQPAPELSPAFSLQDPSGFEEMYSNYGDRCIGQGSFWRPTVPAGCFSLGDYAQETYAKPSLQSLRVIRPIDADAVKNPMDFELIWKDSGTGAKDDGSFWKPVPPVGYVALGTVTQKGHNKPDVTVVGCVREDLVSPAVAGNCRWLNKRGDESAAGGQQFAVWSVEPSDASGLRCGTFVGSNSWDKPGAETPLRCLNSYRDDQPDKKMTSPQAGSEKKTTSQADDNLNAILIRINRQKLFFNQVMWISQEPGAVIDSLRDVKWPADATRALSDSVNPQPVTVTGNYVGYRWHFDDDEQRKAFLKQYIDTFDDGEIDAGMTHSATVAVATGGVFGEAVLGQAVSAEKIDLTRFWKWQDSMIPILPTQINPLTSGNRARDINTTTGQLSESAARLDQLTALPDPAGFSAASQMMTSNIFRDMSGSDVVQALALDASKHAADGADNAAKIASQNLGKFMDLVKELGQTALQKGMDSTTLGGIQAGSEEESDGGEGGGEAGVAEEAAATVGPEIAEVAEEAAPFVLAL